MGVSSHNLCVSCSPTLVRTIPLSFPRPPDVLDYRIDKAGFLAAFPYLLMAVIVQSAGVLADLARTKGRLTTTQVRLLVLFL